MPQGWFTLLPMKHTASSESTRPFSAHWLKLAMASLLLVTMVSAGCSFQAGEKSSDSTVDRDPVD